MKRSPVFWLYQACLAIQGRLALIACCGLCDIAVSLAFVYVSKLAIDYAIHGSSIGSYAIYVYGMALLGLYLLELGLTLLVSLLESKVEIDVKNRLRHRLFDHLAQALYEDWEQLHSGDVLNRMEEDVRIVSDCIAKSLPKLLVAAVQVVAAFIFLYVMNPMLACAIVFVMPLFLLSSKLFFVKLRKLTKDIRDSDGGVQVLMQESLQHQLLLKSMNQYELLSAKLSGMQSLLYGQTIRLTHFNLYSRGMVSLGFIIGYMIAFVWGLAGLQERAITYGMMTAFLQLVGRIQRPTVELAHLIPSVIRASASIDRLQELEALPVEMVGGSEVREGILGLRIEDLSFRYRVTEKYVYRHFSYDFKPGSRTAVVGETGAGKTTLVKLMLSLLYPEEGHIVLYDKEECVPMSPHERANFVYVPQGNSLLSGTVRSNLCLGNANATDEQMWEALHVAVADFVKDLPGQLDSRCGEFGDGLSEGQAQRIAIARGLLQSGSIMLLDELSASLDENTERTLIERLMRHVAGKTVIFVTHRKLILQYCDDVITL